MRIDKKVILVNVIKLINASEKKYKEGDFKGAIEDKRQVRSILNSKSCDKNIKDKLNQELCLLYQSKFDLISDYKLRIDEIERNKIIKLLEQKSEDKYQKGDFKGAIKALRRSEKFL